MNTNDRCQGIVERIRDLCNEGKRVSFVQDWGGNTLTLFVDNWHTHVGTPDGSFGEMARGLKDSLNQELARALTQPGDGKGE